MYKFNRFFVNNILLLILCILTVIGPSLVNACENVDPPNMMLKALAHEMIESINENRETIKADSTVTRKLIEDILLPHADFAYASKFALRYQWDSMTNKQREDFRYEFQLFLVRISSIQLGNYIMEKSDKLDDSIMSFDDDYSLKGRIATVKSTVNPKASVRYSVRYKLKCGSDAWKIVEVVIDGVPVIQTYSKNFRGKMQKDGFSGLMAYLRNKNKQLLASKTK